MFQSLWNKFKNLLGLNYESTIIKDHIKELQFGDIILVRCPWSNVWGFFIQLFLREPYYHCAMYIDNKSVFEAEKRGVGVYPIDYYKNCKITVLRPVTELTNNDIFYMVQLIGLIKDKKYDWVAFLYMFWTIILMRLGLVKQDVLDIESPWDNSDRFYCYQAIAFLYKFKGWINVAYTNATGTNFYNNPKFYELMTDLKKGNK